MYHSSGAEWPPLHNEIKNVATLVHIQNEPSHFGLATSYQSSPPLLPRGACENMRSRAGVGVASAGARPKRKPAPEGSGHTPLILTHGWPWSFLDWVEAGRRLADPAAFGGDAALGRDVVIPSLPGFGFSAPLRHTGIGPTQVARLWLRLMTEVLGYARFGAAGGDWGAMVTLEMGCHHP